MFGQIYPGQEGDYETATRFGERPVGYDDQLLWSLQMANDPFASPINLTGYGYESYEVTGSLSGDLFELVIGDDVETLSFFWNLRATRVAAQTRGDRVRRVLLAPPRLLDDHEALGRLADALGATGLGEGVESPVELFVNGSGNNIAEFENSRWLRSDSRDIEESSQ